MGEQFGAPKMPTGLPKREEQEQEKKTGDSSYNPDTKISSINGVQVSHYSDGTIEFFLIDMESRMNYHVSYKAENGDLVRQAPDGDDMGNGIVEGGVAFESADTVPGRYTRKLIRVWVENDKVEYELVDQK